MATDADRDRLVAWEKRMAAKKEIEEREEAEAAERERQAYLQRTGRTEMKP